MKHHIRTISLLSITAVAIIFLVQVVNGAQRIPPEEPWWVPVIASFLLGDEPLPEIKGLINDTGVTFGGDYLSGNNGTCTSNISSPQDCHQGRDAMHDDDSDGHAGFSFTKLDANGNALPADATSWVCVKDNVTGRVWETKTTTPGAHYYLNEYRWGGVTRLGSGWLTYYNDWSTLVATTNNDQLCGFSDWRVPHLTELQSLINYNKTSQMYDTNYFPYPRSAWSAVPSSSPFDVGEAWIVGTLGDTRSEDRDNEYQVRLVRSDD